MTSTLPLAVPIGVAELLPLMVRCGATMVRMPDGLEVHLPAAFAAHPLAGQPAPTAQDAARAMQSEPICPCGHPLATEHVEAGCIHGCPHDACSAEAPSAD